MRLDGRMGHGDGWRGPGLCSVTAGFWVLWRSRHGRECWRSPPGHDRSDRFVPRFSLRTKLRLRNGSPASARCPFLSVDKAAFCQIFAFFGDPMRIPEVTCSSRAAPVRAGPPAGTTSPRCRTLPKTSCRAADPPCSTPAAQHRRLSGHVEHRGARHVAAQDRRDVRQVVRHGVEFADAQRRRTERRAQENVAAFEERREPARNLEGGELGGDVVGRGGLLRVVALASVRISKSFSVAARPNRCSISRTVSAVLAPTMVAITAAGSAASTGARSST